MKHDRRQPSRCDTGSETRATASTGRRRLRSGSDALVLWAVMLSPRSSQISTSRISHRTEDAMGKAKAPNRCEGTITIAPSNAQCIRCGVYGQRCDATPKGPECPSGAEIEAAMVLARDIAPHRSGDAGLLARVLIAIATERNGLSTAGQVLCQSLTDEATAGTSEARDVDGDDILAMVEVYHQTVKAWSGR